MKADAIRIPTFFGTLTKEDREICDEAIKFTHLEKIADTDFLKISDGQKQRVLLARAICQDTKIIVLDEPTSYLDMFYKLDILKTIHFLARKKKKSIIMSLHELELVKMISDTIICVGDGCVKRIGKPGEIFAGNFIQNLYGINDDEFDPITCTVKLHL
ncbi:ABC transporter ATP-binding protein [Treponema zioleckii]|uniref:ATP-binding cassette domain-containing protein n=1 Tax=Treponema zioleckii TaxID=331680 RepID=UPI00168AF5F0|nr:ABC transporter ATP-binding protein [Treponema zioleckii]